MEYLMQRLKEPSTVAGVVTIAALFGVSLSQEQWTAVFQLVIAGVAVWQVFRKEEVK